MYFCEIIQSYLVLFSISSKKYTIMLPYKEKVFREKPYTQCFECIQGPKLKCKNCMATLIADILRHKASNDPFHKENTKTPRSNSPFTLQRNCRTVQSTKHRQPTPEQHYEIRTNFGLWVEKMQAKRTDTYDPVGQALAQWPHRKAASKQKISKIEQARFENWESRLLQRFSKNSPEYLKLQKHHQMQIR